MTLIPRDRLFELAEGGKLTETDGNVSFSDIKDAYHDQYVRFRSSGRKLAREMTYTAMLDYLKAYSSDIRYVASGTSRTAFIWPEGKCLKMAMNESGAAQNSQEYRNSGDVKTGKYSCFTHIYDVDGRDFGTLLTECCSKADADDIERLMGLEDFEDLATFINQLYYAEFDLDRAFAAFQKRRKGYENDDLDSLAKRERVFMDMILDIKDMLDHPDREYDDPQMIVMKDLVKFYIDHGNDVSDLLPGDLGSVDNWGLAIRRGKPVLVIIDAGFSDEVCDRYY